MDAFHRLIRFGHAAKARALPVWKAAMLRSEPTLQWLKPRFWRGLRWLLQWLRHRRRPVMVIIVGGVLLYLSLPYWPQVWGTYKGDRESFTPFFTPIGALLVGLAAFGQWRTARLRHEEQTNADRQRRITESFSKAVEQLGSDKLEVRLGGIYSLERISKESPDDYWTVMENLTAFVRERSRRNEAERTSQDLEQRISRRAYFLWLEAGQPDGRANDFWTAAAREEEFGESAADIVAVLTVLKRRSEQSREREGANGWHLNLNKVVLKQSDLSGAHLERAGLSDAHLEGADFMGAHLEGASLERAHLEGANLRGADLKAAFLSDAHFERADLAAAHLETANLTSAHLKDADLGRTHADGANLSYAHLEGANLRGADLKRAFLSGAHLEGGDLTEAHLEEVDLRGAHLEGADLRGAHLEGADLKHTHLRGANLRGVHLERADLRHTHLEEVDLRGAHLKGADLSGARLEGANLGYAHLEGVDLGGAHLEGADLRGGVGLLEAQLRDTDGDAATILPEGVARPAHWPGSAPKSAQ